MILERSYGSSNGFLAEGILSHTPDPHHTVMISTYTQQNWNKNNGPTHIYLCKTIYTHTHKITASGGVDSWPSRLHSRTVASMKRPSAWSLPSEAPRLASAAAKARSSPSGVTLGAVFFASFCVYYSQIFSNPHLRVLLIACSFEYMS